MALLEVEIVGLGTAVSGLSDAASGPFLDAVIALKGDSKKLAADASEIEKRVREVEAEIEKKVASAVDPSVKVLRDEVTSMVSELLAKSSEDLSDLIRNSIASERRQR